MYMLWNIATLYVSVFALNKVVLASVTAKACFYLIRPGKMSSGNTFYTAHLSLLCNFKGDHVPVVHGSAYGTAIEFPHSETQFLFDPDHQGSRSNSLTSAVHLKLR